MGALERLRSTARAVKRELKVYRLILADRRTPWLAKGLLGLALGYLALPFDLIPDFVPVVGHLDDVVIVPALILLALRLIPKGVVEEARRQVLQT